MLLSAIRATSTIWWTNSRSRRRNSVLLEAGYEPKDSPSRLEFDFCHERRESPSRSGRQYSTEAPHAVELHLDIWDSDLHQSAIDSEAVFRGPGNTSAWNENDFPALADEEAFLTSGLARVSSLVHPLDSYVVPLRNRILLEPTRARLGTLESSRAACR